MSLFKTTIEQVTGRGYHMFGDIGIKLFNTDGLLALEDNDVTQSAFLYRMNLENDIEGITRIESVDSADAIAAYGAVAIGENFILLSIYPGQDADAVTEDTMMPSAKIILAYAFSGGSILYLKEGTKAVRYLVSQTVDEILELARGATTTSTTTTTTTTSTTTGTSTSSTSTSTSSTTSTTTSTTTAGAFTVTSGIATDPRIRLQSTEIPLVGSLVIGEWTVTMDGAPLTIASFSGGNSYIDIFMGSIILAGTTILVSYGGITAESTFGTDLDTFTDLEVTNNTTVVGEVLWDDGVDFFRLQVRDGALNLDQTITPTGFSGVITTDWDVIWSKSLP